MSKIHPILLILLICFVECKYSYFDKCYRYEKESDGNCTIFISINNVVIRAYQYYTNRHGELHTIDNLVLQRNKKYWDWSFYYQYYLSCITSSYTLSNCVTQNKAIVCDRVCESVWFKLLNTEQEPSTTWAKACDPIFLKTYGDVS